MPLPHPLSASQSLSLSRPRFCFFCGEGNDPIRYRAATFWQDADLEAGFDAAESPCPLSRSDSQWMSDCGHHASGASLKVSLMSGNAHGLFQLQDPALLWAPGHPVGDTVAGPQVGFGERSDLAQQNQPLEGVPGLEL